MVNLIKGSILIKDNESVLTSLSGNDDKKLYIKKSDLNDIIKIFINLISSHPIFYLVKLTNDKEDFVSYLSEEFSESVINKFIAEKLEKYGVTQICIDDFFDNEYELLSDDTLVRNALSYCHFSGQSGFFPNDKQKKK